MPSIQEQPLLGISNHPVQPLLQVHARHGAAGHDVPFVCADGVESQALAAVSILLARQLVQHPSHVTYLAHLHFCHGTGNIALVLEDEQAGPRKALHMSALDKMEISSTHLFLEQPGQLVATIGDALAISCIHYPDERVRLLEVILPVGSQCLLSADVPCAVSCRAVERRSSRYSTDIQFVAFFVRSLFDSVVSDLPIVFNRLDDKAQCRADAVNVLVHDLFHYRCLPCIVQSPYAVSLHCSKQTSVHPQHEYSHLLILQPCFSQNREHLASRTSNSAVVVFLLGRRFTSECLYGTVLG